MGFQVCIYNLVSVLIFVGKSLQSHSNCDRVAWVCNYEKAILLDEESITKVIHLYLADGS